MHCLEYLRAWRCGIEGEFFYLLGFAVNTAHIVTVVLQKEPASLKMQSRIESRSAVGSGQSYLQFYDFD